MNRTILNALGIFAILGIVGIVGGWLYAVYDTHQTQVAARGALDGAAQTLKAINAPCTGFHGSVTCGPIAQLSQTEKDLGILAGQGVEQERQLGIVMTAAAKSITSASQDVHTATVALKGTADAGTGTLSEATTTLKTANGTIAAFQTVLDGATKAEGNVNDLLKRKAVGELLDNLAAGTETGDAILTDVHVASHPFLNPDPCKTRKCRFGRYVWPVIRTGLGLGGDLNGWKLAAGEPLKVRTQ